jgi:hypothetical protein
MKNPHNYGSQPPIGMYKVNWDAIVDKKHGRLGFCIVVRDYEGFALAGRSTTNFFLAKPVVAEALATLHVVEISKEMGLIDIILKGDSLQIVLIKY